MTPKEAVEFVSPLHAPLWDAWRVCSRDPEQFIGQWAREGVPLGMDMEIPESGIYPSVEAEDALETKMDMGILRGLKDYDSVESRKEEAILEVDRYVDEGFCRIFTLEEVRRRFPEGTASRLALILKQKPDGSTKRRIVIDMKRSKGNERAHIRERIVLPRAQDIVTSLRVMRSREHELREQGEPRSVLNGSRAYDGAEVEFFLLDLQDTFCHFGVHPEELKHCVSPGMEMGTAILWVAMLFGFKGAPYHGQAQCTNRKVDTVPLSPCRRSDPGVHRRCGPRDQGMQGAAQPPIGEGAVRAVGLRCPDIHGQR